ncbi:MAG: hypothetical protein IH608_08170 [Proteobacteria bacterium]|nr:hypothetical protein [Pseudomonadota bacterium]
MNANALLRARPQRSLAFLLGLAVIAAALVISAREGHGCFGARLRIGVPSDPAPALAAYAAGYYVEEKTGIEPEFVELSGDPGAALAEGAIDFFLATGLPTPDGVEVRPAGVLPGVDDSRFWIRRDVLDDLRFFTLDRALQGIPGFYGSEAFREAARAPEPARKAARQAVHRAD